MQTTRPNTPLVRADTRPASAVRARLPSKPKSAKGAATAITVDGKRAGVAVRLSRRKLCFFASAHETYALDGRMFVSIQELTEAVQQTLSVRGQSRIWLSRMESRTLAEAR